MMKKFAAYLTETGQYEDVFLLNDIKKILTNIPTYSSYVNDLGEHHDVIKVSDFFRATTVNSSNYPSTSASRRKK